jgi:ABC-type uncharacterized transport system YnjBCD ATPase subunit
VTYNSVSDIDSMLKDKIRKLLTMHAEEASVLPDLDKELAALDAPVDANVIDMEPAEQETPPAEPDNA